MEKDRYVNHKGAAHVSVSEVCREYQGPEETVTVSSWGMENKGYPEEFSSRLWHQWLCALKTVLAPASITKSEIGSGPALLMKQSLLTLCNVKSVVFGAIY